MLDITPDEKHSRYLVVLTYLATSSNLFVTSIVTSMWKENGANNENALLICRTVLHDLSVLVTRRTMQINSRPMEIITCILKQKVAIYVVGEFH